jgi:hypothetical protein
VQLGNGFTTQKGTPVAVAGLSRSHVVEVMTHRNASKGTVEVIFNVMWFITASLRTQKTVERRLSPPLERFDKPQHQILVTLSE